jgi:hypothetical protein
VISDPRSNGVLYRSEERFSRVPRIVGDRIVLAT